MRHRDTGGKQLCDREREFRGKPTDKGCELKQKYFLAKATPVVII